MSDFVKKEQRHVSEECAHIQWRLQDIPSRNESRWLDRGHCCLSHLVAGSGKNLANHNPGSIRWQNPKVTLWTPQYSKVQSLMVGSPRKASLAHPNACGQRRVCIGSDPQGRIFGSHNRIPALLEPYSSSWCLQYWKPDRFALFSFDALEPLAFPPLNPATSRSILYPCFYQQVSPYTKKQRCFMLRNQFCCQHCQQKARSKIL